MRSVAKFQFHIICLSYPPGRCGYSLIWRLVHLPSERALQVWSFAGDIVSCSWVRHFTHTVPLSTQVYKWVPANLMREVTLWWTSIPSRGSRNANEDTLLCFSWVAYILLSCNPGHISNKNMNVHNTEYFCLCTWRDFKFICSMFYISFLKGGWENWPLSKIDQGFLTGPMFLVYISVCLRVNLEERSWSQSHRRPYS